MVQNAPLNEEGTGPAPKSGSSFQPLGTSLGAVTTPQQNTEAALASMGQGGHQLSLVHQPGRGAAAAVQVPEQSLLQVKAPPAATPALVLESPDGSSAAGSPAIPQCPALGAHSLSVRPL